MAAETAFDLTQVISPYLDRHLILPLVEFLEEKKFYAIEDLLRAKLNVIKSTKMAHSKIKLHKSLYEIEKKSEAKEAETKFAALEEKYKAEVSKVGSEYKRLLKMAEDLLQRFSSYGLGESDVDPEKVETFKKQNMIDEESLKELYGFARFAFESGQYSNALNALLVFRILTSDDETAHQALWGKLAAGLLCLPREAKLDETLEEVVEDINQLRDIIGRRAQVSPLQQLVQRAWLVNWSLFAFLSTPELAPQFVKFILHEKILNAVQIRCPYVLRYLVAAVMISYDTSKMHLKQCMDIIEMEKDNYRDPLTEFMRNLLIEYNFEAAHKELVECEKVFKVDYFLGKPSMQTKFFKNARHLIFELYCRIHKRIDVALLAKRLNLDQKDTDKALVDLIRSAPFEGKIDSKKNQLVISTQYPSIHQKVIDKTKGLANRTQQIADAINKRMQSKLHQMDAD
mmetsp:Transcript_21380/g.31804  ORF Transcript_21380/g.31804 Transcript_21380/m.31804 type:complete len:456 (-) Transcript_21380:186-1553(-)